MNFFQQQEKARKQSRWLLLAFAAVTLLIVLIIDVLVLIAVGMQAPMSGAITGSDAIAWSQVFTVDSIRHHADILAMSSAITVGIIGIASLGKIASLRSGGAEVAVSLGGTLVSADTRDPLKRRLYNVVEEIAIASGTSVPDIFVLENERAINAFAAGYGTADAAVAVTQGTLEKLNRAELQGVIAHEFSHIFNGDMRINIRLMGVLFGIMVLAIIGRKFLHASRYQRSSKSNSAVVVLGIGLSLTVIGYTGLLFARWMKSALSRQREYLADASAVQFTRHPEGIAGALKKIAAYNHHSYLKVDSEEVSHMLFANGIRSAIFATHPPLEKRIGRIEQGFNSNDIETIAKQLKRQESRKHAQAQAAEEEQSQPNKFKAKGGFLDIEEIMGDIGHPSTSRIAAAALLADSMSDALKQAAHSTEWAPEVLLYCLLDHNDQLREQQLLIVMQEMGEISEGKLRHLISANGLAQIDARLPLFEIAFPSLKRRPQEQIEKILNTADQMSLIDNKVDSFEYLLSRLIRQTLFESHLPNRTRLHGRKKLNDCIDELTLIVSTLAAHGQNSSSPQGLQYAQRAFKAGMGAVGVKHKNLSFTDNWQLEVDKALATLDRLSASEKAKAVRAMATTVLDDKKLITEEQEMMRVICGLIHVPLPLLNQAVL